MTVLAAAVIICAVLAGASIVWFSLRTGIGPMPSSIGACRTMIAASERTPIGPVLDLGSGWGTLAIAFAKRYPQRQVIGYELSWVPWFVSSALKHLLRLQNLSFRRQDFVRADFPAGAVVLCYLCRRGMRDLSHKLGREGNKPSLIVSNTFALPSSKADAVIRLDDLYRTPVYVYRLGGVRSPTPERRRDPAP